MSTISVPLNSDLEEFIEQMIREKKADNKAELIRRALYKYMEDQLFLEVMEAQEEAKRGEVFSGDLKDLVKKFQ